MFCLGAKWSANISEVCWGDEELQSQRGKMHLELPFVLFLFLFLFLCLFFVWISCFGISLNWLHSNEHTTLCFVNQNLILNEIEFMEHVRFNYLGSSKIKYSTKCCQVEIISCKMSTHLYQVSDNNEVQRDSNFKHWCPLKFARVLFHNLPCESQTKKERNRWIILTNKMEHTSALKLKS